MVHELDFVCVRIRSAGFSSVSCSRHFISESLVRSMIAKIRNGQMADRQLLRKYLDEQRTDNIRLHDSSVLTPSFNY